MNPINYLSNRPVTRSQTAEKRVHHHQAPQAAKRQKADHLPSLAQSVHESNYLNFVRDCQLLIKTAPNLLFPQVLESIKASSHLTFEYQKLFISLFIQMVFNFKTFTLIQDGVKALAKLPHRDHHPLPLQVIHGNISYLKDHAAECKKFSSETFDGHTLLHIAACAGQWEAYHFLLTLPLDPWMKNRSDETSFKCLLRVIEQTDGTLDAYDALFDAVFCIEQLDGDFRTQAIAQALYYGISYQCLELVLYAKNKAQGEWPIYAAQAVQNPAQDNLVLWLLNDDPQQTPPPVKDKKGRSLLHWATALQLVPQFDRLLGHPHASGPDHYGNSPLHFACQIPHCQPHILDMLVRRFSVQAVNAQSKSPWHYAFERALYENCRLLPPLLHPLLSLSAIPLFRTIFQNEAIDPSFQQSGANALHFAAGMNLVHLAEACLKSAGNWHRPDSRGKTPLRIALDTQNMPIFQMILESCKRDEGWWEREKGILNAAGSVDDGEFLESLLDLNPPHEELDRLSAEGFAPLHGLSGKPESVDWTARFLQRGANPNALSIEGYTPLHYACAEQVGLLVKQGASLNANNNILQNTPLHISAPTDEAKSNILRRLGADPLKKNLYGLQPFEGMSNGSKKFNHWILTHQTHQLRALAKQISPSTFHKRYQRAQGVFPSLNPEAWIDYYYQIDSRHFQYRIPEKSAKSLDLRPCMDLMQQINAPENQRESILLWLNKLTDQEDQIGVPEEAEAKEQFYAEVKSNTWLIFDALPHQPSDIQRGILNDLFDTSRRCGGAWLFDTKEIKSKLLPQESDYIPQTHQLMKDLQEHILRELSLGNVHQYFGYTHALHQFIPTIGHPRADLDVLKLPLSEAEAIQHFFQRYTVTQVIDTLLSRLQLENPGPWLSWLASDLPDAEKAPYFDTIYDLEKESWLRQGAVDILLRCNILSPF